MTLQKPATSTNPSSILGLDVGSKRIGIAIASSIARLPRPYATLEYNDEFFEELQQIVTSEVVSMLVIGFPRGLAGQYTAQTAVIEDFLTELKKRFSLPIHTQDEAVTSRQAEAELHARGKQYERGDIDALAATYILEDFLAEHRGEEA